MASACVLRAPGFAAVAILTLALGIGANTAIFSTINDVLFRPLPYGDPDRIVMVWEDVSYLGFPRNTPAPANYLDWKARNRVFTDIAATRGAAANLTSGGPPEQVLGRRATANFFGVLDVKPLVGRTFTDEEDRTGAPVAVISYGLWQRRFGGSQSAVGADVTMNGAARTVIGVMPAEFSFRSEAGNPIEFWTPMQFTPAEAANRGSHYLNVVARLRPERHDRSGARGDAVDRGAARPRVSRHERARRRRGHADQKRSAREYPVRAARADGSRRLRAADRLREPREPYAVACGGAPLRDGGTRGTRRRHRPPGPPDGGRIDGAGRCGRVPRSARRTGRDEPARRPGSADCSRCRPQRASTRRCSPLPSDSRS